MIPPFETIHQDFLDFLKKVQGVSRAYVRLHRFHVARFLEVVQHQGCLRWADLTARHIDVFTRRHGRRLSRSYRANALLAVRRFIKYLHFRGLIERPLQESMLLVRTFRGERLPRFLTPDQLKRLLAAIPRSTRAGRRNYAAILLLVSTGVRAKELLGLTLDDIDWREKRARVRTAKSGGTRIVPVPDAMLRVLADYIQRDRPAGTSHRFLFVSYGRSYQWHHDPRPFSYNALSQALQSCHRQAGIPLRSCCHRLRHTYAQHLLDQGMGYPELLELLGHHSLHPVTSYARIDIRRLREVADNDAEEI